MPSIRKRDYGHEPAKKGSRASCSRKGTVRFVRAAPSAAERGRKGFFDRGAGFFAFPPYCKIIAGAACKKNDTEGPV